MSVRPVVASNLTTTNFREMAVYLNLKKPHPEIIAAAA